MLTPLFIDGSIFQYIKLVCRNFMACRDRNLFRSNKITLINWANIMICLKKNVAYFYKSLCLLMIVLILILIKFPAAQAASQSEIRNYLTKEILQDRTNNLVQHEGIETIDLSNYIIDISSQDSQFSLEFYQEIKNQLSRASNPISLDLSNSIIQGDFDLNQLGILSPVAEGTLSSLLTLLEQEKINRYYPLITNSGRPIPKINIFRGVLKLDRTIFTGIADFSNTLFLQKFLATETTFQEAVEFNQSIFSRDVDFNNTIFKQNINFNRAHFFDRTEFLKVQFKGIVDFSNSQFEGQVEFNESTFSQLADFTRSVFSQPANFSETIWHDRLLFTKSKFLDALLFINSTFEKTVTFRDVYINSIINLQDAHLLNRIDFSNAFFTSKASINTSGLAFDSGEAQIIGETGIISDFIYVNRLEGNETILRNLIRNFRSLEQIADANQIEYQREKLRLKQLGDRIINTSWQKIFSFTWISLIRQWLSLSLLLLLGDYGTNVNLLSSIGIIAIAFFSFLFWFIDRYRPKISQPIIPNRYETISMFSSYLTLTIVGTINIFITTDRPWLTLACMASFLLPIPLFLVIRIYYQGRYHKLLDTTYFVKDGSLREFRLLLGRLPIIPLFPFYRDRYYPLLWNKRWNWLNYYDFSLNNILKFGFNDIRLRDEHLPGIISTLVWYQWCLGVLYIILLLWTLSRTIPGLNLLIYF